MTTLSTVGHGARPLGDLIAVLRAAGVVLLVDVRRFPGSRRHPQFGRGSLEKALPEAEIAYEWWGEELGGRRSTHASSRHVALRNASFRAYADFMDTDVFRSAIDRLEGMAHVLSTAVMCAETLWWRCHRRHIADVTQIHGFTVRHLLDQEEWQSHTLHPALRIDDDGYPVYDGGRVP
jgi:uncharacterized protein (DUF488 family)